MSDLRGANRQGADGPSSDRREWAENVTTNPWKFACPDPGAHEVRPSREERVAAFLAFKFGKRPSDSLLEYCAQWGHTPGTRYEARRLLAKRRARRQEVPDA